MLFVVAVGLVLGTVSLVFAFMGYWLILPFAGLEIAALLFCTWLVAKAGTRCEVVSLDESQVVVEKGSQRRCGSERGGPESRVSFPRAWVRVELQAGEGWYPDRLLIGASGSRVELGEFLADAEKKELAGELKKLLAEK
jgi:uncharacterized membrane protein